MRTLIFLLCLCTIILGNTQCSDPKHAAAKAALPSMPTLDTLRQNFWSTRTITVVYPESMEKAVSGLPSALGNFELRMLNANQASLEDMQGSLFLIGTPENNRWLKEIQPIPALRQEDASILLNGDLLPEDATALLSFYPNPTDINFPIFVAMAYQEDVLAKVFSERLEEGLTAFGWGGWQYEVYQGPYRIKCGKYHSTTWETIAEQQPQISKTAVQPSSFFDYHWHGGTTEGSTLGSFMESCDRQAEAVLDFCGKTWGNKTIPMHCFPSMEDKAIALNNTTPLQIAKNRDRVDAVANAIYHAYWLGPQNQLILREILGKPATPLLEAGLGLTFNPKWQKYGYQYWKSNLAGAAFWPALSDVSSFWSDDHHSPFLRQLVSAVFCDFLIQQWGKAEFLNRYPNWKPNSKELYPMEESWQKHLSEGALKPVFKPIDLPYLKGFNFAHEGYAIYNGYGSQLAAQMLEEQIALGANAIAIVPYSYMRSPKAPTPLPIMDRAGTENDESVIRDLVFAHKNGLSTVLKPQIWLGGGHWPGSVKMTSEQDWATFFEHYTNWILHYAMIAEIYDADVFCIGVEFAEATLEKPDEWRDVIRAVRSVYKGPVTYAANWGQEFEKLDFWEELDFIGLNCYYPLSESNQPSKAALAKKFEQVLQKAEKISRAYDRPLLLTEIGFTSTTTPWLQPHHDGDGGKYSGEAQLQCYQVVIDGLVKETEWCRGILWWKYPSYPTLGGEGHTGFTPNNKPTEEHLLHLFRQLPE